MDGRAKGGLRGRGWRGIFNIWHIVINKIVLNIKSSMCRGMIASIRKISILSKIYSETLNNEYIERIHQMSYSSHSDNGTLQIFSFLIKWLYETLKNCSCIFMAIYIFSQILKFTKYSIKRSIWKILPMYSLLRVSLYKYKWIREELLFID